MAVPPVDLTVRVWWDRDPELFNPGVAPYIAAAALYRAAEYLDEWVVEETEQEEQ